MPNAAVHRTVGTVAGAAFGGYQARGQQPLHQVIEAFGGAAGGWLGSAAPDWIDPATSPNHRHVGHGALTVPLAFVFTAEAVADWQNQLRQRADELAQMRWQLSDDWSRFWNWVHQMALRFLAGILNGFNAGYLSHLVLDALTPRGLPLIARGC